MTASRSSRHLVAFITEVRPLSEIAWRIAGLIGVLLFLCRTLIKPARRSLFKPPENRDTCQKDCRPAAMETAVIRAVASWLRHDGRADGHDPMVLSSLLILIHGAQNVGCGGQSGRRDQEDLPCRRGAATTLLPLSVHPSTSPRGNGWMDGPTGKYGVFMAGTDLRAVRLGQSHPPSGSRLGEAFPQKIIRDEWRSFSPQLRPPPTGRLRRGVPAIRPSIHPP